MGKGGKAPGSRAMAAGVAGALFILLFVLWAGPSWPICVYRLATDGVLALLWIFSAAGIGAPILGGILKREKPPDLLGFITSIAIGLGVMSLAVLGLGLAGWLNRATAMVLLLAGLVLFFRYAKLNRAQFETWASEPAGWGWLWLVAMLPASAAAVGSLLPPGILWGDEPNGYDVVEYHLQIPRQWYEAARITPLSENVFSYFPQGVEMQYLLAMELRGGPWMGMYLSQFMHAAMCGLSAAAVCGAAGEMAGLIVALTPWVSLLAPVAYVEGGELLYVALALAWAMRAISSPSPCTQGEGWGGGSWANANSSGIQNGIPTLPLPRRTGRGNQMILAGVMAGLACGTKLTNLPMLVAAIPIALIVAERRIDFKKLAAFVITAMLVFSPWLLRTAAWSGNPVFPQAMNWLGQGHFTPIQVERWRRAYLPTTGRMIALGEQILWDWRYGFVLLPAALLAAISQWKSPPQRFLLAMLLIVAGIWLFFTHLQSRFFVPAIPIAAMLIAPIRRDWIAGLACLLLACDVWFIGPKLGHYLSLDRQLAENNGSGMLGLENLTGLRGPASVSPETHLDLVGDAQAFWYTQPMSRLTYRTVFGVDTSDPNRSIVEDWLGRSDAPLENHILVIDPAELARFARTYYAIPPLSEAELEDLSQRPDVYVIGRGR